MSHMVGPPPARVAGLNEDPLSVSRCGRSASFYREDIAGQEDDELLQEYAHEE